MDNISSIQDFISCIKKVRESWGEIVRPWFRGEKESEKERPLLPKLYQKNYDENQLVQNFRMMAPIYGEFKTPHRGETDLWLFLMRHVGLPTRLLDWTEGALIALFFAINDVKENENPVVWVLNPYELNHLSELKIKIKLKEQYNVNIEELSFLKNNEFPLTWKKNLKLCPEIELPSLGFENIRGAWEEDMPGLDLPVAITPTYIHPRMAVQKSRFTIHGKKKESINELVNGSNILVKLKINREQKIIEILLEDLRLLGVSYSSLFPDLDGLAKELKTLWCQKD